MGPDGSGELRKVRGAVAGPVATEPPALSYVSEHETPELDTGTAESVWSDRSALALQGSVSLTSVADRFDATEWTRGSGSAGRPPTQATSTVPEQVAGMSMSRVPP